MADSDYDRWKQRPDAPDVAAITTARCPYCGYENLLTAKKCANRSPICGKPLKSELDCLRSADRSLASIRRIAIWFLILSILWGIASVVYAISQIK